MEKSPFIFFGNLLTITEELPLLLLDDLYFKKPSESQQLLISSFIDTYSNLLSSKINKFENEYIKKENGFEYQPLEKKYWKYHILENYNNNLCYPNLQLLFSLSSLDLTVLFEASEDTFTSISKFNLRIINYLIDDQINLFREPQPTIITQNSINELTKINLLLNKFDEHTFPKIKKSLNDFIKIKDISDSSPFKVLSYFAILELLLTRDFNALKGSSISDQLKSKLNFLNNQFENKIEFSDYFKGPDSLKFEMIIEKLYKFRNDIAHGNKHNFEKELSLLQGVDILPFLSKILQQVLIISLEKPQMIADLQPC